MLLLASKEVVGDAQFVINQRGIGYKNFIPATFGSQAARKFSKRSKVTIKQTTLDPTELEKYSRCVRRDGVEAACDPTGLDRSGRRMDR